MRFRQRIRGFLTQGCPHKAALERRRPWCVLAGYYAGFLAEATRGPAQKNRPYTGGFLIKQGFALRLVVLHVSIATEAFQPTFLAALSHLGNEHALNLVAYFVDGLVTGVFAFFGEEDEAAF